MLLVRLPVNSRLLVVKQSSYMQINSKKLDIEHVVLFLKSRNNLPLVTCADLKKHTV